MLQQGANQVVDSDARLEDKAKFIEGVMGRKATVKSLEFPDMTVQVVGNGRTS